MNGTTRTYPTGVARGVKHLSGAVMTPRQPAPAPQQPGLDFTALVAELVRQSGMDYGAAAELAAQEHPDVYAAHRARTTFGSR